MALVIRSCPEPDEKAVAALWRRAFPDAPSWNDPERDIRRKLSMPGELFGAAILGVQLVGMAMAGFDGRHGWLYYLTVSPQNLGKDLGEALIRRVGEA
jgi:hypothetical protein